MLLAAAGLTAALVVAPTAAAQGSPSVPQCVDTGGAQAIGGTTTQCATPGNVSINATPAEPTYLYPWDDEFYGPALIIGGFGGGFHGGGHGGR